VTITEFLEARIAEDEKKASALLRDLEGQVSEEYAGMVDERGPMTPTRLLGAQMWAQYAGQSKRRSFAKGQQIAYLANPMRVLAECAAKRAIIEQHKDWPVLVEKKPEFREDATDPQSMTYRVTQEMVWLTEWEYVKRFGVEAPTAPMIRALAAVYSDHPDYNKDWAL
jgi:hypothetical protein